ncbi:MAG: hypothetical protein IT292_10790 [Deltaproteobacteria bacterium]|nr:hypothetical protein [Deltaproteobacteria bacterium]
MEAVANGEPKAMPALRRAKNLLKEQIAAWKKELADLRRAPISSPGRVLIRLDQLKCVIKMPPGFKTRKERQEALSRNVADSERALARVEMEISMLEKATAANPAPKVNSPEQRAAIRRLARSAARRQPKRILGETTSA